MALRPPSTPRSSGLPVPGGTPSSLPTARRKSGIPLNGRPPSSQTLGAGELDSLRQAVRANDPGRYDSPSTAGANNAGGTDSPSPAETDARTAPVTPVNTRRVAMRKPSLAGRPTTPSYPRTPIASYARSATPTNGLRSSMSASTARPSSRLGQSVRGPAANGIEVGDAVKFEVSSEHMEGIIRFLGEVEGKDGQWAGVELDSEWHGRGKNDGSVKGTQYFACEPLCGLFLPLSKITVKSTPPTPVANKITAGSRASKYLGMTAAELASKKRQSMGPPPSPTKATPRRSISPEKPSALTTPRAARARPSIGGLGIPTPRKSLSASTPRPSLGSSIKRPPSSLRNYAAPDVPPVPSAYSLSRSVTPSSNNGRATPATPSATTSRRMSAATESTMLSQSHSRPTTPSVRSHSRQSFASSTSRASFRSTLEEDAIDDLKQQLAEGREREVETRKLLQGSERLGREMEDKLAERERKLKEAEMRIVALEKERERDKEREMMRMAGGDDREKDAIKLVELETRLEELLLAESTSKAVAERLTRQWETKCAAKEGENESLRERLAAAVKAAEEEQADLTQQLEQLRSAGQALCETYEERIADIEVNRLESLELAETLQLELDQLKNGGRTDTDASASPATARLRQSLSTTTSAADVIDAESAKADLEHLRTKVNMIEEQLEDTRDQLETEIDDAKKRRVKTNEAETNLKKEIKTLKETVDQMKKTDARNLARIEELEDALLDAQTRLEEERNELEGLRSDATGTATANIAEDLKQANKQLDALKLEKVAASQAASDAQRTHQQDAELIGQLRADLQAAENELQILQGASDSRRTATPPPAPTQDTSSDSLHPSPAGPPPRRSSLASSHGSKDDAEVAKDQILGLKVIIKTLEEENAGMNEKNKVLVREIQELRDAQVKLGSTSVSALPPSSGSSEADTALQREVVELRSKLQEAEKKSEREIKALNQEVSELESLVESKIYREDELEAQVERYKIQASKVAPTAQTGSSSRPVTGSAHVSRDVEDGECEMCGEGGHDLDSCPIFAGSNASPTKAPRSTAPTVSSSKKQEQEFCDDCEEYGHSLDQCPLANEIF